MKRVKLSDPALIDPFEYPMKIHESTKIHIRENVKLEIYRGYNLHADGREIGYYEEKVLESFPTNLEKELGGVTHKYVSVSRGFNRGDF